MNESERIFDAACAPEGIKWRKPTEADVDAFECGDSFLVAVPVRSREDGKVRYWWEYAVITATETGWEVECNGWGWDWSDVVWYIPCKEMAPSPISEQFSPT